MARAERSGKVLILSGQVMTAALVGWYVELAKLEPAFAAPGERPDDALARVRPVLVLLVDAELPEAMSDLLVARAAKRGAGMALFAGSSVNENARDWSTRHDIPYFMLPIDLEAFGRVLDRAARQQASGGDRRMADRRGGPSLDRAVDGTLILCDPAGHLWYVYDRRSGDRRGAREGAYRAFVDERGVERRYPLLEGDLGHRDPDGLAQQLAQAVPVEG